MNRRLAAVASFVLLTAAFASPRQAAAQIDLGGAARVSFNGSLTEEAGAPSVTLLAGLTYLTEGGAEFGFDVTNDFEGGREIGGVKQESSQSGFFFLRGGYNFIGESLTVPFVSGGIGFNLANTGEIGFTDPGFDDFELGGGTSASTVYELGGGIKRFLNERASFDVMGNYRDALEGTGSGSLSVQFGMSLYFGN